MKEEPTFQYKFLTSDPANLYANPSQNAKRTVQIVAQSQIVAEAKPSKRLKLDIPVTPSPSDRDVGVPNNVVDDEVGEGVDTSLPPHLQGDRTTPVVVAVETPQQVDVNGDAPSEEEPLPQASAESLAVIHSEQRSPSVVQSETIVCAADQIMTNGQADIGQLEYIDPSQQYVVQLASPEDLAEAQSMEVEQIGEEQLPEEQQYIEGTLADGQLLQVDETGETQVLIEGGVAQLMGGEQFVDAAQVFQTEDGLLVIQAADGTLQIHGQNGQAIPMETVQALLGMDLEGAVEQIDTEQVEQMQ